MTGRHGIVLTVSTSIVAAVVGGAAVAQPEGVESKSARSALDAGVDFIDTSFENASPLWWDVTGDGSIHIHLNYDHERSAPNRAAGHVHFQLQGRPGAKLTLEFHNLDNIYNGRAGSVADEMNVMVVSTDGREWKSVSTEVTPDNRVRLAVELPGPSLYVAHVEPYRLSDLEKFLSEIKHHPAVQITRIGTTVEGRELEIVRIGNPQAPFRVFVRARAHPWEAGGNWIVEGLVRRLLKDDADARQYLGQYCAYVMPMANKDGVVRGRTRFNLNGKDLNRDWDQPADPQLAPENSALESWLVWMIQQGQRPDFALEVHNDGYGGLHLNSPPKGEGDRYFARMKIFEDLLRKHTWFTVGSTTNMHSIGTLANGWQNRFGIEGAVHEFNCQWIEGLKEPPLRRHWQQYGEGLARVFFEYYTSVSRL
jgi:hypothetical protein